MQRFSGQVGGNRMGQIKEGLDSGVARILDGAQTLYLGGGNGFMVSFFFQFSLRFCWKWSILTIIFMNWYVSNGLKPTKSRYEAPPPPDPEKGEATPRWRPRISFSYGPETPKAKVKKRRNILAEDSDEDSPRRMEEEEEAMKHWTLEAADDSIQGLISSIRCDERLDALEDLSASCSHNASTSQQLNSEMDELEKQLYQEWQDIWMDQTNIEFWNCWIAFSHAVVIST